MTLNSAGRPAVILFVDDEPMIRRLVGRTLDKAGYKVLVAGSAAEAVQLSQQHEGTIDMLLTDIVMPGGNGDELAAQLAEQRPDMKVLFMSGTRRIEGAFIAKPFTMSVLLSMVKELIDE
ncbi:MAG: response regulator [Vicinamibacteria bacterium]|nr:response regulator [Vicinamibacteria bacterium]